MLHANDALLSPEPLQNILGYDLLLSRLLGSTTWAGVVTPVWLSRVQSDSTSDVLCADRDCEDPGMGRGSRETVSNKNGSDQKLYTLYMELLKRSK